MYSFSPKLRRSAGAYQALFSHLPVKPHYEYFVNLSKSGVHIVQVESTDIIIIFPFCLPCYVTTSLTLSPRLLKANWGKSHQALHGACCVCAEFTILCFIVTNILSQDSYCKHPFWQSKSNQKDLSIPIRPARREITASDLNYGGKEEWNQKVLVSLVSSCKKRKATIYNC